MAENSNRSADAGGAVAGPREGMRHWTETIHRAFVEFLTIPTLVVAGFVLLAVVMYFVDDHFSAEQWSGLFSDVQATRDFLGVIAGSIITVTSITLSLLLIAVQQGATALTSLVFDQFLRRRTNQIYFGSFIGLALYALIVLATVNESHRAVFSTALAGVLTVAALYTLLILIYTTIDQMRPVVIIRTIHDHTLLARECQLDLLRKTRRTPRHQATECIRIAASSSGFMTGVDVPTVAKAVTDSETEVVILVSIGDYVAFGDAIAEVRMARDQDASALGRVIAQSLVIEDQRDLDTDPAFGIEQLVTIGWTSISTAKSNPDPGLLTIWNLRDLLARWLQTDGAFGSAVDAAADPNSPVVYIDNLPNQVMGGLESLAVVASESMQYQCAAEIYRTFAVQYHRLPPFLGQQTEELVLRSLSGLGDHILTSDLDASLSALAAALKSAGRSESAARITTAVQQLGSSNGRLNSRSTRARAGDGAAPDRLSYQQLVGTNIDQ